MKKLLAVLVVSVFLAIPVFSKKKDQPVAQSSVTYETERAAVGSILIPNPNPDNGDGTYAMICSGSEIGRDSDGNGIFLTARHCVWEDDDPYNGVSAHFMQGEVVSFNDNLAGPYYQTQLYAISKDDDLAVLKVINGGNLPTEVLQDENSLKAGDPVENISFPMDMGKLEFHGEFIAPIFPHVSRSLSGFPQWVNSMPVDITIGPGSSGSPLFDSKTHCQIGVMVGTSGVGRLMIAEPISLYLKMMENFDANSVDAWIKSHLPKPVTTVRLPQ